MIASRYMSKNHGKCPKSIVSWYTSKKHGKNGTFWLVWLQNGRQTQSICILYFSISIWRSASSPSPHPPSFQRPVTPSMSQVTTSAVQHCLTPYTISNMTYAAFSEHLLDNSSTYSISDAFNFYITPFSSNSYNRKQQKYKSYKCSLFILWSSSNSIESDMEVLDKLHYVMSFPYTCRAVWIRAFMACLLHKKYKHTLTAFSCSSRSFIFQYWLTLSK